MEFDPSIHPHRRYNPLTGEYVLVSPHRLKRPWQGQTEQPQSFSLPDYNPDCYLCPGNKRSGGQQNEQYTETMLFENDFAALLSPPRPAAPPSPHPLLQTQPVGGVCDVLVFHPRHDLTIARLTVSEIETIIDRWKIIYTKRGAQGGIKYVQIFENKGAMMGCSNPHPHGQVWSLTEIPSIPGLELQKLREYANSENVELSSSSSAPRGAGGTPCLLCEYAHYETSLENQEDGRIVIKNDHWVTLVPWWAVWPFETLVLPYKRHISSLVDLTAKECTSFATILSELTIRYDNLFLTLFAYSMGLHQRPIPSQSEAEGQDQYDVAHLHLHFSPPLLRSASVRKFLVGLVLHLPAGIHIERTPVVLLFMRFELVGEPQRDLTAEQAAQRLRACATRHYLDGPENSE